MASLTIRSIAFVMLVLGPIGLFAQTPLYAAGKQPLNSKIDWTQKLGNAVIDQQADVMDALQRLRGKAQANNKLQSTEQQKVVVTQEQGRQVIAIEPTDPNTVYVPYYHPGVVYYQSIPRFSRRRNLDLDVGAGRSVPGRAYSPLRDGSVASAIIDRQRERRPTHDCCGWPSDLMLPTVTAPCHNLASDLRRFPRNL
jgi:Protein of unknown function (DUF3300)